MKRGRCLAAVLVAGALSSLFAGCATLAGSLAGATLVGTLNPIAPLDTPGGSYVSGAQVAATDNVQLRAVRFQPTSSSSPLRVSLVALPPDGTTAPRALRRAFVVPPAARPCTAGWMAESVWVGELQHWNRPVSLADEFELAFLLPWEDLRQPLMLDLLLEDEGGGSHCHRLPLGSADDAGLVPERSIARGGGLGLVLAWPRSGRFSGTDAGSYGVQLMGSLGYWLGRWRLGGRLEVCVGGCAGTSIATVPILAVAEWLFYAGPSVTVAASAGYEVGRIEDAIGLARRQPTWAHGPRLAILVLGPRPFVGVNPGHGFAARGLELFVSRQFSSVGDANGHPPSWLLGLSLVSL